MTLVQLAASVDLSARSLSAYENGQQDRSPATLRRLAAALDVQTGFLTADNIDEIPVDAISFRAPSKLTAGQRDTARSAARVALLLAAWIDHRFHLPRPDVPSLPTLDPETAADVVRARWGLRIAPLGNLARLLEAHGVRLFSLAALRVAVWAVATEPQSLMELRISVTADGRTPRSGALICGEWCRSRSVTEICGRSRVWCGGVFG